MREQTKNPAQLVTQLNGHREQGQLFGQTPFLKSIISHYTIFCKAVIGWMD